MWVAKVPSLGELGSVDVPPHADPVYKDAYLQTVGVGATVDVVSFNLGVGRVGLIHTFYHDIDNAALWPSSTWSILRGSDPVGPDWSRWVGPRGSVTDGVGNNLKFFVGPHGKDVVVRVTNGGAGPGNYSAGLVGFAWTLDTGASGKARG